MYRFGVISLLPELVGPVMETGVVGRAAERGLVGLEHLSPREFTTDRHRTVDVRPYGGGPGMVLKYEPLRDAVHELRRRLPVGCREFVLTAQGKRDEAKQAYQKALQLEPGLPIAHRALAKLEGRDAAPAKAPPIPPQLLSRNKTSSQAPSAPRMLPPAEDVSAPGHFPTNIQATEQLADLPPIYVPEIGNTVSIPTP